MTDDDVQGLVVGGLFVAVVEPLGEVLLLLLLFSSLWWCGGPFLCAVSFVWVSVFCWWLQ